MVNILKFVRRMVIVLQCGINIIDVMPLPKFWAFPPLDLGRPVHSGGPFFLPSRWALPPIEKVGDRYSAAARGTSNRAGAISIMVSASLEISRRNVLKFALRSYFASSIYKERFTSI